MSARITALKAATGIACANCETCIHLGTESDGGEAEYATSWPVCRKHERYSDLSGSGFPFQKEMPCWSPDFWHSKFSDSIDGTDASIDNAFAQFNAAIKSS